MSNFTKVDFPTAAMQTACVGTLATSGLQEKAVMKLRHGGPAEGNKYQFSQFQPSALYPCPTQDGAGHGDRSHNEYRGERGGKRPLRSDLQW